MDIKNLNRIFLPFFKTIELKLGVNIDNKQTKSNTTRNKGNGAGGNNTNYYGKKFEQKTNNEKRLLDYGFSKKDNYYLSKTFEDKSIVFVSQNGLKKYMKNNYKVELFRNPDEAYIIEYNNGKKVLKILEKKEQHMHGSVETKLWASSSLKKEYQLILGSLFEVDYCLCVNNYYKEMFSNSMKYAILTTILNESKINILFGDDENYFESLDNWIYQC